MVPVVPLVSLASVVVSVRYFGDSGAFGILVSVVVSVRYFGDSGACGALGVLGVCCCFCEVLL